MSMRYTPFGETPSIEPTRRTHGLLVDDKENKQLHVIDAAAASTDAATPNTSHPVASTVANDGSAHDEVMLSQSNDPPRTDL